MKTTPAGTITGLLIGTDDTVKTVEVPMSVYTDDDGYTDTSLDRRKIAEIIGCSYVEHFPVKYPASDPDGIGALCDENGRYEAPANRIARKVVAELNGVSEADIVSLHGAVSLGADQIEEITAIADRVRIGPDLPDTEAQTVVRFW